ncbi:MAG: alpha/beta fold hydrolase [Actinobacteria bacterium]|nr:alpha/beta fold hydrolase [Actinomycetota bacterium]MSZ80487.1 alpha/beta fold hydrolase [Actinomycetota bacterium]MTB13255.1 alpha/beta fold hydrolase [Actinomycetota bacterium]
MSPVSTHCAIAGTRPSTLYVTLDNWSAVAIMTRPRVLYEVWSLLLTISTVPSCPVGVETIYLETIDGVMIEADLVRTDADHVRAVVIIGHPHPLYGGDRFNHVVRAMQEVALRHDCHSVAVDFRGVNNSGGIHDNGDSERLDLAAACELADLIAPEVPIIMTGYSFGSVVGLNVSNPWIAGWIAVAPPARMMTSQPAAANSPGRKILITAEHDQFTTPEELAIAISSWSNSEIILAKGVDHSFAVNIASHCDIALSQLLNTLS